MAVRPRVAFQGDRGAYSEQAALQLLGAECTSFREIEPVPCASFDEVFEGVQGGVLDWGVVPIENSLAGSIHRNYDLLLRHDLSIVGECNLRISHCLIAHPGVSLGEIRRVYSHPQALAQCEHSLATLDGVEVIAAADTAGSVRLVKEQGWQDAAAIASEAAAALYGMAVLRRAFEDERHNYTRFLLLSREASAQPAAGIETGVDARALAPEGDYKTSLAFAGRNEPGLLFKCLSAFALRDIDLTKIESRPIRGVPWEYVFYLDFSGSLTNDRCRRAVEQLREMATFVRVFGSYPRTRPAWNEPEVEGE